MIRLKQPLLFFIMCGATVFVMPFLFGGFKPLDEGEMNMLGLVLLIAEVAAYMLWIGLFTQFNMIVITGVPVGLAILRMLLAALGAIYVNAMGLGDGSDAFMKFWVGQPLAVVLQILVFIYLLPYLLAFVAPGVLADTVFESIMGKGDEPRQAAPAARPAPKPAAPGDVSPTGGLLQIYTIEDIKKYFDKVAGLEGFAIYTSEGLLFCHDLTQDQQVERLGVRLQQYLTAMQQTTVECDLEAPRRLALETENFTIFLSPITPHFWGLFIFNRNVTLDNCHAKIRVMSNSIKSFITTRYMLA